ncbi:MAG: endonuclease/exonuclease/phosphatase family protein [Dehalococcoidales bacterium]|nr:endonuclease/exonuclease/phosphatase family protein [Dehalococcoidales bacterium]
MDNIISLLRTQSPDLVSLQEIAVIGRDGRAADQVAHIASALGMYHAFAPVEGTSLFHENERAGRDFWGNAVLSRFPILDSQTHEFAAGRPHDSRSLAVTRVLVGQQVLTFASVHLSYIWRTTFAQAQELAALAARTEGPFIVAGDFNASAGSAELSPIYTVLRDAFSTTGKVFSHPCRLSFPDGPRRERDLDHIFHSPHVSVAGCAVCVDETRTSDHNPVVAEVLLPLPAAKTAFDLEVLADDLFA